MNIVIIAYRPDHTDVCRGCVMGSTESDMQYAVFDTSRDATEFLAKLMTENNIRDIYEYAAYEFSYVINGLDEYDWEPDSVEQTVHRSIYVAADKQAEERAAKHKEDKLAKEAEDRRWKEEQTKQRELKQLAELQAKYDESK